MFNYNPLPKVQVGIYTVVCEAGSRAKKGKKFRFKDTIAGVKLKVDTKDPGGNALAIEAEAKGAELTGRVLPADVTLTDRQRQRHYASRQRRRQ